MTDNESTASEPQETAADQPQTGAESTTPTIGPNDGALPPEVAGTAAAKSQYDAALAAGNVLTPTAPSGGDTVAGDGVALTAIAHPDGAPVADDAEPNESAIETVEIEAPAIDPAITAYETDRIAAVANGDTSWPTWGFLDLDKKMEYVAKAVKVAES